MDARSVFAALVVVMSGVAGGCGGGGRPPGEKATPAAERPSPAATESATAAPRAVTPRAAWRHGAVVRHVTALGRLKVRGRPVAIDPSTLTCTGVGRPFRRGATRVWTRFRCVQPTFPPGSVSGPDAIFFVEPTGHDSLTIAHARFTAY